MHSVEPGRGISAPDPSIGHADHRDAWAVAKRETYMRVTILGATGRIGSLVLADVLAAGHTATILTRGSGTVPETGAVTVIKGDIADAAAIRRAVDDSEAVVAALGPRRNAVEDELDLEGGMRNLVDAMTDAGVGRLVALSGAAVDVPGDSKPLLDRIASRFVRLAAPHVVGAKQREYAVFAASDLDWTALRPAIVTAGEPRGYHLSDHLRPGARVTRADVAAAISDQLTDRAFIRMAPFVLPGSRP